MPQVPAAGPLVAASMLGTFQEPLPKTHHVSKYFQDCIFTIHHLSPLLPNIHLSDISIRHFHILPSYCIHSSLSNEYPWLNHLLHASCSPHYIAEMKHTFLRKTKQARWLHDKRAGSGYRVTQSHLSSETLIAKEKETWTGFVHSSSTACSITSTSFCAAQKAYLAQQTHRSRSEHEHQ